MIILMEASTSTVISSSSGMLEIFTLKNGVSDMKFSILTLGNPFNKHLRSPVRKGLHLHYLRKSSDAAYILFGRLLYVLAFL